MFVFIHGGAFLRGSSSAHGPARLLAHDVVLVTLNYRIGALGKDKGAEEGKGRGRRRARGGGGGGWGKGRKEVGAV